MAREQLELRAASGNEKPVFGISEWMCYYANYDKPCPGPKALDECVDLHLQAGCDHLVWNLGRSVVDYWSELPISTRMCENGDQDGLARAYRGPTQLADGGRRRRALMDGPARLAL